MPGEHIENDEIHDAISDVIEDAVTDAEEKAEIAEAAIEVMAAAVVADARNEHIEAIEIKTNELAEGLSECRMQMISMTDMISSLAVEVLTLSTRMESKPPADVVAPSVVEIQNEIPEPPEIEPEKSVTPEPTKPPENPNRKRRVLL